LIPERKGAFSLLSTAFRVILSVFTALYTFIVLGSCSIALPAQPVDAVRRDIPREPETVTLNILNSRPEIAQALQESADLFLQGYGKEASIRIHTVGGDSSYRATLRARLKAGEQVDLFHIFGYKDALELQPYLEDLSPLPWGKEAIPFTLEPVTLEEILVGIPYSVDAVGLIVNRDIFQAAGIPLEKMADFEGLEESFRTLREQITLGELKESYPDLEAVTEVPGQDYAFVGGQMADITLGGEFATAAQAATSSSILMEREKGAGRYLDLLARYATNGRGWANLPKVTHIMQVEEGLAAQRVAAIQQKVSIYSRVEAVDEQVARRLRLLPIPLPEEEEGKIYAEVPAYWAVGANAAPESKALALDFLTWLYQSETGATLLATRFGVVSPYRNTAVDTGVVLHKQMLGYIEQGAFLPRRYQEFPADWVNRGFGEAVRSYFSIRELTWEEAMERVRKEWSTLRAQER